MHILVLEAYDGGSHGQFLNGLIARSRQRFTRFGLPARKWKWRMRGSALYFARQLEQACNTQKLSPEKINLIFTSDMTSVADLRALLPEPFQHKPIVCYFHENQLTYPLPHESQRDYQYGFTNITSCLAADAVWFNSRYHRDSFLDAAADLLKKMPDYVPENIAETIRNRSTVMPLGLPKSVYELPPSPTAEHTPPTEAHTPPTVLWNHRWEYDKNPEEFFEVLFDLQRAGIDFRLMVAGQTFRTCPPIFAAAHKALADKIDHFGYVADRTEYEKILAHADIIVSTARHEFFGLSVLEAVAARCYPLLPNRLSYPELIPAPLRHQHLYHSPAELREKLTSLCLNGVPPLSPKLYESVTALAWPNLIKRYDQALEKFKDRKTILPPLV